MILIDSFGQFVYPFLALGIEAVDVLDLRAFTGSTRAFIRESQPNVVIILYNPTAITPPDYTVHTTLFDFR